MSTKRPLKAIIYSLILLIASPAFFSSIASADFRVHEAYAPTLEYKSTYLGGNPGGQFGAAITSGDINGDGFDDLIVGSPFSSSESKEWNGSVSVFYGSNQMTSQSVDLANTSADLTFQGEHSGDQLGTSITVGDYNNDGVDDLALGAYNAFIDDTRPGKVYMIFGQSTWTRQVIDFAYDKPNISFTGYEGKDQFGLALSTLDVNNDGIEDVLIGAPNASSGELKNSGAVYTYFGGFDDNSSETYSLKDRLADITFYGQQENENFGSVIGGGNIMGDYKNDVAIGAYKSGKVYLYKSLSEDFFLRSGPTSTIESNVSGEWFGFSFDVGDINNDGLDDIAISSFPYSDEGLDGYVSVFYGSSSFATKHFTLNTENADITIKGDYKESILATSVILEDLDKDELPEIIMGAPAVGYPVSSEAGNVFIAYSRNDEFEEYDVSKQHINSIIHGDEVDDWFGYSLNALDFNGDGNKDLAIGARYVNGSNGVNNGKVFILFGNGQPYGVSKLIPDVAVEETVNTEEKNIYATRGAFIGSVIEEFDLVSQKSAYIDSCYEYREFCLFNFLAMTSYEDVQLEPSLILYPDVLPGDEYYDDIVVGTMLGLVNGYMDDNDSPFRPEESVSRIQALKVILGATSQVPLKYKFELVSTLGSIEDLLYQYSYFNDVDPRISYMWWYPRYINFAVENGIIDDEEYFRPDDNITVEELNDLIMRTNAFINSLDEETQS